MEKQYYTLSFESPIGPLHLVSNETKLLEIGFGQKDSTTTEIPTILHEAAKQLGQYFQGTRTTFTVDYLLEGTSFQKTVWQALSTIAYGTTISYQQLAESIDNPKAFRAVGLANNRNKLAIIIPCHRVIGKDGSLVGYAGGLEIKQWLLQFEQDQQNQNIS